MKREFFMTDAKTSPDTESAATRDPLERLENQLKQWRTDIDEVIVQLNLASKDVRDELGRRIATAQDVELAARSRLGDAGRDLVAALVAQRENVVHILKDIRLACESAKQAAERHRASSEG